MQNSQWDHLLRSNDPPLDTEIPAIRHFISEKQKRLEALESEIKKPLSERDEIADCIEQHTAILAPIRRVPAELLSEIFSLVPFTRLVRLAEEVCAPWILGHICKSWRDLAIHSPLLWRRITIPVGFSDETYPPSMFEAQLIRSGAAPLDVHIDFRDENAGGRALVDLLIAHCHRWGVHRNLAHGKYQETVASTWSHFRPNSTA